MKLIALKIDVDNLTGILQGVPRLLQVLSARACGATFFWSLGTEKNGRFLAPSHSLRRMAGASLVPLRSRFSRQALCRGSFWPAPQLAKDALRVIKTISESQFEHGLRPYQNFQWQNLARSASVATTEQWMSSAIEQFRRGTGQNPLAFSATAWQTNQSVYRFEQLLGFSFASDTRGTSPFFPVNQAEISRCVQLPVTLPMLEELTQGSGLDRVDVLLQRTLAESEFGHVYNAAADFDGMSALADFERLIDGWLKQGYQIVSLGELSGQLDLTRLNYHEIEYQTCLGRVGLLASQGRLFPN